MALSIVRILLTPADKLPAGIDNVDDVASGRVSLLSRDGASKDQRVALPVEKSES